MAKIARVNNDLYYVPNPGHFFSPNEQTTILAVLASQFHVFLTRPWSETASQEPSEDWLALLIHKSNHRIVGAANPIEDFAPAAVDIDQFAEARRWLESHNKRAKGYQERVAKYLTQFFAESCFGAKTMNIGVHEDPSPREVLVQYVYFDTGTPSVSVGIYAAMVKTATGLQLIAAANENRKFYPASIVDRRLVLKKPSKSSKECTLIEPAVIAVQSWLMVGLPRQVVFKA